MSRIRLQPLTEEQILLYVKSDFSFEDSLNLDHVPRAVDENVQKKLTEIIIPKMESDVANVLFYTLWVAIDTEINTAVAGIVFKGPPNENGEVELGAGTFEGFMNRGYMTETTKLLCEHALKHMPVKKIVANCRPDNVASQRTLEKSGFKIVMKEETNWRWEIQTSKI